MARTRREIYPPGPAGGQHRELTQLDQRAGLKGYQRLERCAQPRRHTGERSHQHAKNDCQRRRSTALRALGQNSEASTLAERLRTCQRVTSHKGPVEKEARRRAGSKKSLPGGRSEPPNLRTLRRSGEPWTLRYGRKPREEKQESE